jgi:N-acetylneuraminic acid mutarotase
MAEQTLSTGSSGRRRVLFGLLDGDGWTWAFLKAGFWFVTIIMLLGYIPDRAYYFAVFSTIDVGVNVISPINFCAPSNRTLPCPAPAGAPVPWDPSPAQLALPGPRTDGGVVQAGTSLFYIGGTDGTTISDKTFTTPLYNGNFGPWQPSLALPAARTDAATIFLNSSIYVIGGDGSDGKPTTTVYVSTQDSTTGVFGAYAEDTDLKLPSPRASATVVAASDGLILVGGTDGTGPTTTVWKSTANSTGKQGAWSAQVPMPQPRSEANGSLIGSELFVYGGRDASGPTATVLRANLGTAAVAASPSPAASGVVGAVDVQAWATGLGVTNLPAARTKAAGFTSNGVIYLVGGSDGTSPKDEVYWTTPDANGNINGWLHLSQTDLPVSSGGLDGSAGIASGSQAFVIGGTTSQGIITASARANLAPQPPFFALGLIGATIPALKIDGDVGQQLGYLSAAGAGTVDFIILILIGWAFAHKDRTRAIFARLRRRRH